MLNEAVLNNVPRPLRAWQKVVSMTNEAQRKLTDSFGGQIGLICIAALFGAVLAWGAKQTDGSLTTNSQLAAMTVQITALQTSVQTLQGKLDKSQSDADARYVSQVQFADFVTKYKDNHDEAMAWQQTQTKQSQDLTDKLNQILTNQQLGVLPRRR
jgi:hypothetical protein